MDIQYNTPMTPPADIKEGFFDDDLRDTINLARAEQEMRNRKRIIEEHKATYNWWRGENGNYYTYLPDGKGGRKRKRRQKEEDLEELVYRYHLEMEKTPSWQDLFYEQYKRRLEEKEIKLQTYTRYENAYLDAYGHTKIASMKVKDISRAYLADFVTECYYSKNMDLKAYNMLKTVTIGILKVAYRKGLIDFSPTGFFADLDIYPKKKNKPDKSLEIYSISEVKKIKEYVDRHMDTRSIGCLLVAKTGMRVGEAAALKPEDIDLKAKAIRVRRTEVQYKDRKTKKYVNTVQDMTKTDDSNRWVTIDNETVWYLKRLIAMSGGAEYLISENGVRIKEQGLRRKLKRICKQVNIVYRPPHKLRKTVASMLEKNGVPHSIIASHMGHHSFRTTELIYIHDISEISARQEAVASGMDY